MKDRTKLDQENLLIYEMPVWFEFISIGWIQDILAYWLARRVSVKIDRYNRRLNREKLIREHLVQ